MENIGIDIGTFKTVISSSHEKGRIIYDELSKRSFPTAVQLTSPKRRFGNLVVQSRIKINKLFTTDLTNPEHLKHANMFLQYCRRLISQTTPTTSITLSIPYYFTDIHKRIILSLFSNSNCNVSLIQDTTASALASLVKIEKKSSFINIMDLGYSKTTTSSFTLTDSLTPTYLSGILIGSKDIDSATLTYLSTKYPSISKFTHRIDVDYMKTLLNSTPTVQMCVELPETSQCIEISQQEYEEANKEVLTNLEEFFYKCQQHILKNCSSEGCVEEGVSDKDSRLEGVSDKDSKTEGVSDSTITNHTNNTPANPTIIVVGGNSNNYLIRKTLSKYFNVSFNLNADESVSNGSAFSSFFYSAFSLSKVCYKDILYNAVYVDDQILFISGTLLPSPPLKVTYKKKNTFTVNLRDSENKIGSVTVFIKEDKVCEVSLFIGLDRNGIVRVEKVEVNNKEIEKVEENVGVVDEVEKEESKNTKEDENINADKNCSYKFEVNGLKEGLIQMALEEEIKCRKKEEEYEIVGNMRNGLEMGIKKLVEKVEGEERRVVEEIKEDLGFMELSGSIEEENKLNEEIRVKLKEVERVLRSKEEVKYKSLNEVLVEAEGVVREAETIKGDVGLGLVLYKLKGGCFRLRKVLNDLERTDVLFGEAVDCRVKKEVKELIQKVRKEILRRKEEIEREKVEREEKERKEKERKEKMEKDEENVKIEEEKIDEVNVEEERMEEKMEAKMEEEMEEEMESKGIDEEGVIIEEVIEEITVEQHGVTDTNKIGDNINGKEGIENKTFNDTNFATEDQRKDKKVKEGEE